MFCEVIPLRSAGLRLRVDEWPTPERGRLAISHMPYSICAARRTLREVQLMGEWVSTPRMILQMFDPEFVDVVGDGFLLRGLQTSCSDGRAYDHEQLWLVRPRTSLDGPPLPRFDPSKWVRKLPVEDTTGKEPSISAEWHKRHVQALEPANPTRAKR